MAKRSFQPSSRDRNELIQLPPSADALPDVVSVDLNDEDPENFEIVEVDDTPEQDRGKPTKIDDPLDVSDVDVKGVDPNTAKRIKRLTFETNTERRAREQAERERDAAVEFARQQKAELDALRQRADGATHALGQSMLARNESSLNAAKARLTAAIENGDGAAQAEATAEITELSAEKMAIAARVPKAPKESQQPQEQQRQVAPAQPQTQTPTMAPNVAAWLAQNNGWWSRDTQKTKDAMAIHNSLRARGVDPASDAYIKGLDKGLKALYPDHTPFRGADDDNGGENRSTTRRPNPVADGGREQSTTANNAGSGNPRRVELTRSELSIAKRLGVTPQAYAAEKARRAARGEGA